MAATTLRRRAGENLLLPSNDGCDATGPWSVVRCNDDSKQLPPSGDPHDLMSFGTYTWPCNEPCNKTLFPDSGHPNCAAWHTKPGPCNETSGLPWVPHDGFHNRGSDRCEDCGLLMVNTASQLALAGYLFGNASFTEAAATVVRVWFLDNATRMNPTLQYAAIKPPPFNGTEGE